MRSARTSRIFALPWSVSVTIPACEPVNDTAGTPSASTAMHNSDIEMRSPAVSSMSISRPPGCVATSSREADEVVGGLAHRRDHDHDVVAAAAGARDVIGDGPDAVGIRDRGSAELLDDDARASNGTSGRLRLDGRERFRTRSRYYSVRPVTRADKRARQKERTRQAQEAREAAVEARAPAVDRHPRRRQLVDRRDPHRHHQRSSPAAATTTRAHRRPPTAARVTARRLHRRCADENPSGRRASRARRAMTIDPAKTYTATISTTCGDITIALDAQDAARRARTTSCSSRTGVLRRARSGTACRDGFRDPGRRAQRRRPRTGPGYAVQAEVPARRATRRARSHGRKGGPDPTGHRRVAVLHRRPAPAARASRPTTA